MERRVTIELSDRAALLQSGAYRFF